MRVSVIIPTYKREAQLAACLKRLFYMACRPDQYELEIIVTDDAASPACKSMLQTRFNQVKWVAGPGKGPASNRNNGAKHANGEWLAFLDDDCLPDDNWIYAYIKALSANPSCQVLEGRTYVDRPARSLDEISPINETGGYLWSCNFMISRQLFEKLGGFDERFPHAALEDVDLYTRLRNANHQIQFVPDAAVMHPWRKAGGWIQLQRSGQAMQLFLDAHPDLRKQYGPRFYLTAIKNDLIQFGSGLFKFHGRGSLWILQRTLYHLYKVFVLWITGN